MLSLLCLTFPSSIFVIWQVLRNFQNPYQLFKNSSRIIVFLTGLHEYEQLDISEAEVAKDVEIMKSQKWLLTGQASYEDLPLSSRLWYFRLPIKVHVWMGELSFLLWFALYILTII